MSNILVLGASGQIARLAIPMLAERGERLTLFARSASRVSAPAGATVIEGDVLDRAVLAQALQGQDAVYANLGGDVDEQAAVLVEAMGAAGVSRLVFVLSLGIYHELPQPFEAWNEQMIGSALSVYRRAADTIEASDLDYTLVRPAWLTDADEIDYELTQRGEQFAGTEVSRASVAAFITEVLAEPGAHSRASVGIDKPGTDGPKPAWY